MYSNKSSFTYRSDSVQLPMPGFGSSDCTCKSHLFFATFPITFADFNNLIQSKCSNDYRLDKIEKMLIRPN